MRRHQIIEFNPNYADTSIYKYKYDQYNRAVTNIDFHDKLDMSHPLSREEVYKNTVVLSNYNRSAHTLETWTYVESTVAYLLTNKFKFFQTIFLDYLNGSDLIKHNSEWTPQHEYHYSAELERIGLTQNKINWVNLTHEQYLGEYAHFANKLAMDKMHPDQDCHSQWTTEILIPKLQEMQILNGRSWEDRTPTAGFEDQNDIHFTKDRYVFIGPASRNRTHIQEVEALCIIHYTMASYLVREAGLEPTYLSAADFKSAVYTIPPLSQKQKPCTWQGSKLGASFFVSGN